MKIKIHKHVIKEIARIPGRVSLLLNAHHQVTKFPKSCVFFKKKKENEHLFNQKLPIVKNGKQCTYGVSKINFQHIQNQELDENQQNQKIGIEH